MAEGDLHDQIARIEAEIDELAKTLDGCRKAMLFSKVAMAAGGIWIFAYLLGAIRFDPAAMIGAIAATVGGVVVLGQIRVHRSRPRQQLKPPRYAEPS